jgi:hypothetical protein
MRIMKLEKMSRKGQGMGRRKAESGNAEKRKVAARGAFFVLGSPR